MDVSTGTLIMILCYVFGTGLIIMEAFMPGFGIAGIAGIVLEIIAVILTNTYYGLMWSLIATFALLLFIGIAVFLSYRSAVKGRLSKSPLILKDTEESAVTAADKQKWVGREGIAVSSLRPAGTIEIGGVRLNASTSGEFLTKGTPVRVSGIQGDHLVIQKK